MNKYEIRFTEIFLEDLSEILKYIKYDLVNNEAANRLYEKIMKEIIERAENPLSYEKYNSVLNKKHKFYRIYVNNYVIFYIVYDNIMEVRRILNNRRNIRYFVKEPSIKYKVKLK